MLWYFYFISYICFSFFFFFILSCIHLTNDETLIERSWAGYLQKTIQQKRTHIWKKYATYDKYTQFHITITQIIEQRNVEKFKIFRCWLKYTHTHHKLMMSISFFFIFFFFIYFFISILKLLLQTCSLHCAFLHTIHCMIN